MSFDEVKLQKAQSSFKLGMKEGMREILEPANLCLLVTNKCTLFT